MGTRLVAEYDPAASQYHYYTQDQIGSTRVVTDDAGAVVYAAAHDPYGEIQQTWANAFDPKRKFSDKERDEETGLDYFGARYYANASYRWISVDPVLTERALNDPQEWNLYSYCKNNPLAFRDPDGKVAFPGNVALLITPSMLNVINAVMSNYLAGYISTTRALATLIYGKEGLRDWLDTPLEEVGKDSVRGVRGDCTGILFMVITKTLNPLYKYRYTGDFVASTLKGGLNWGILSAIPEGWKPQVGDIGFWNKHVVVYAHNKN